jgi:hypothetical protein
MAGTRVKPRSGHARAAGRVVCAGIGCGKSAPDPGQDRAASGEQTHRGWIELRVDGAGHRFCSWPCLLSYASDRLQVTAGD